MAIPKTDDLTWQETHPGIYSRSVDATEKLYLSAADVTQPLGRQWAMLCFAIRIEYPGSDLVEATRQAWKWIRYQNPMLASTTRDGRRSYQVANETELESWLQETFIVHDSTENGHQDAKQLQPTLRSIRRATLHLLPRTQEIVLQVTHDLIDGIAVQYLFDQLLSLLAAPPVEVVFGDEAENLAPPLQIAAHISSTDLDHLSKTQAMYGHWIGSMPTVGIAMTATGSVLGNTLWQRMQLSENDTARVIAAAKQRGLTATHVVQAASVLAARKHGGHLEEKNYVSFALFGLRDLCDPQYRKMAAPYFTCMPLVLTPASFIDSAQQVKDYFSEWKADMTSRLPIIEPSSATFLQLVSTPPPEPTNMMSVSSLGLFDPKLKSVYGNVKMTDFWMTFETPSSGLSGFMWTRAGMLTCEFCYNEAFHQEESIARYLEMMKEILFEGLGLKEE
ncbi:hypothetical protein MMC34_004629 [Xylographa carneopallida]|nr:hypothetical protein [Xylographa carneopallida]